MSELTTPKRTRIVYTDKTRKWFETLFNSNNGGRFSPLVKDGQLMVSNINILHVYSENDMKQDLKKGFQHETFSNLKRLVISL